MPASPRGALGGDHRRGRVRSTARGHDPACDVDDTRAVLVTAPIHVEATRRWRSPQQASGVVSTASDPQGRPTIVSSCPRERCIPSAGSSRHEASSRHQRRRAPTGCASVLRVPRTYRARVRNAPSRSGADRPARGLELEDGDGAARVRRLATTSRADHPRGRKRQSGACSRRRAPGEALERVAFGPQLGAGAGRPPPAHAERARTATFLAMSDSRLIALRGPPRRGEHAEPSSTRRRLMREIFAATR